MVPYYVVRQSAQPNSASTDYLCGTSVAHCHQKCTIPARTHLRHKIAMTQREDPRHNLRLSPELKSKLAHAAIDSGRSMNAEILARLEKTFAPDPIAQFVGALAPIAAMSDEDRQRLGQLLSEIGSILSK